MTDFDWKRVWDVMLGLWPKQTGAMGDELQASYRRVVENYTGDQVIPVIRGISDTSKFMPRPSDLRYRVKESLGTVLVNKESKRFDRSAMASFVRDVNQYIDRMTDDRFREAASKHPELLSVCTVSPRKSRVIRSAIFQTETGIRPPGCEVNA